MINDLNYEGIKFPFSEKGYCKIERQNNICINVFCYENNLTYPVYVSDQKFENCMDLLLISNASKSHYVYIQDFNRCMYKKTKNKSKSYLCKRFQLSSSCWIFDKLFDVADDHVRDHCHITGKYRGAAHWSCNTNLKLSKKIPVIFDNLSGYDSHLTIKEISTIYVKVSVISNGLEKYMAFTINRNLVFIDSTQFIDSMLRFIG